MESTNIISLKGAAAFLAALNAPVPPLRRGGYRRNGPTDRRVRQAYLSALATARNHDIDEWGWDDHPANLNGVCDLTTGFDPWGIPANDP